MSDEAGERREERVEVKEEREREHSLYNIVMPDVAHVDTVDLQDYVATVDPCLCCCPTRNDVVHAVVREYVRDCERVNESE